MMPDRRAQVLKLTTSCCRSAAVANEILANFAVDSGQRYGGGEVQKSPQPGGRFLRAGVLRGNVFRIDGYDIGDFAGSWVTIADSGGAVFGGDVLGERLLSRRSVALAETSASFDAAVADNPHGLFDDSTVLISPRWLKPEPGAFASTRHCFLISLIARRVVKSLPAIRSIVSLPRAASRRSPLAVIEPSGNASAAATLSRIGTSSPICGRGGWSLVIGSAFALALALAFPPPQKPCSKDGRWGRRKT